MKKLSSLVVFVVLCILASVCFAADPAATAAVVAPVKVSILDWFKQNSAVIFAALFSVSEVLGLIPGFKGNGVFDTIVKALAVLSNKQLPPAEVA